MALIRQKHFTLISRQDGLKLDGLMVVPDSPKAILQIAHGMCEYKERYLPFMEYMARRGFICVIHDHRGHGKSAATMEDLGYFGEKGGPALVKDLHQITCAVKRRFPGIPFFLMGHSMGSLGVRVYLKKYESELDGLIVCGSPSDQPMAAFGFRLASLLADIKGGCSHSVLLDSLFHVFDLPFLKEKTSHAWICSDREVVQRFNNDPYCNFTFTINGYQSLFWLVFQTYSKKGWNPKNRNLPVLFLSGEKDPCMGSFRRFKKAVNFLRAQGYNRVSWHLYPGMRHEILNERTCTDVFEDIERFLKSV